MSYREFPESKGLCGRKGLKKPLTENKERLNLCLKESSKLKGKELAARAGLSLSAYLERLILSREAEQFTERITP